MTEETTIKGGDLDVVRRWDTLRSLGNLLDSTFTRSISEHYF